MTRSTHHVALVVLISLVTAVSAEERPRKQWSNETAIKGLLVESRQAFLADVEVKEDSRSLQYAYYREGISHSLLLHIAVMQAPLDSREAIATAEAVTTPDVRAFIFTQVALAQAKAGQKENAEQSLKKAAACINRNDVKESAQALWPHAAAVLLWIHGEVKAAEKAAGALGCPWNSLEKEERQFQLAHYHLAHDNVAQALQALHELAPETFRLRRGGEALRSDQGAGLYYWVQQPDSALTAEHILLEWLEGSGKLDLMEQVIASMDNSSLDKAACLISLAEQYRKAGKSEKAREVLKTASALVESQKNKALREALNMDLSLARAHLSGKSLVEALKEAGLLEASKGKPWRSAVVRQVFESGDYELGLKLTEGAEDDNMTKAWVATALIKAGKLDEARSRAANADGLLGPPRILLVMAMEQWREGNASEAQKTLKDALEKARAVHSTNKWFPDKGEVTLQEKWAVMDRLYGALLANGSGEEALKQYQPYEGSIRHLAQGFGARKDISPVRTWMKMFAEKKFGPGAAAFALFGLAEGLESARSRPKSGN